jgi:hypothetical protein
LLIHSVDLKSTQQQLNNHTTTARSHPVRKHQADFDRCVRMDAALAQHCLTSQARTKSLHPLFGEFDAIYNCTNVIGARVRSRLKQNTECELPALHSFCDHFKSQPQQQLPTANTNDTACLASHSVRNGLYDIQLLEWYRVFPREQILTIASERFYSDTANVMKQVERFLGLDPLEEWDDIVKDAYNIAIGQRGIFEMAKVAASETHDYPPMRDDTRAFLSAFYKPHIMQLERITGEDFSAWYQ